VRAIQTNVCRVTKGRTKDLDADSDSGLFIEVRPKSRIMLNVTQSMQSYIQEHHDVLEPEHRL